MNSGIYKITINEKEYVGCSNNLERRERDHLRELSDNAHANSHLQAAYNKHNKFEWSVLEECEEEGMYERETYWIAELNTFEGKGYNMTSGGRGGDGMLGKTHTYETREKMCEAQSQRPPASTQTRKKRSDSLKGRVFSTEWRKKLSEARKTRITTDETKRKMSISSTGKTHSEETKRKMSEARKRYLAEKK